MRRARRAGQDHLFYIRTSLQSYSGKRPGAFAAHCQGLPARWPCHAGHLRFGGHGLADSCGVPFVQEVFATRVAANRLAPGTDCIIELGGEDAKILFLTNGTEVRMNGSCAGGTGAFIDQMATLLKMSADEMDKRPGFHPYLHHRFPLRRLRQERHPASHQPGCSGGGYCGVHLPGRGQPDHRRSGPGPAHQGQRSLPGRTADLLRRAAPEL